MNNKMIELRLVVVLLSVLVALNLSGCGSSKPARQMSPVVQQPAPAPEPMPAPEEDAGISGEDDQPESLASGIVQPNYPERYIVVKGDTLWDISKRFLNDPWLWPSVWHINPDIRNPHLIYPGDIIVMFVIDGKPYITLDGQAGLKPENLASGGERRPPPRPGLRVVKLSPSMRVSGIHKAIPTIPMNAIRPFLDRPRVVTEDELDDVPYIVSSYEEHLISGTGNRVYALNLTKPLAGYDIIRPGIEYIDPETGDTLGYEAIHLADAKLIKFDEDGDEPATLVITKALREVLNNDILLPHEELEQMYQFTPRSPETPVKGQIMAVYNGVSQIGQHMVVVLNRGKKQGLAPGHVLAVIQKGAKVHDSQAFIFTAVDLPDERAGIMMVFKTYENLSYALIMEANRAMHVNDLFENP